MTAPQRAPRPTRTVTAQLRALGVQPGAVLVVHAAFSRVGPVEGGPAGLIAALQSAVGPTGTLLLPTMSAGDAPFDPMTTPTLDMGVVPETFRSLPAVVRSPHPCASFAALGPLAAPLCAPHPLAPPHGIDSPVGRAWQAGGHVLLLGVGHDANTTLHLAEAVAGVPYAVVHPCVVDGPEGPVTVGIPETDHCCEGFGQLDAWLDADGLQRRGPIGHGAARLVAQRDLVSVACARLAEDPLVFLCLPEAACAECDRARRTVRHPEVWPQRGGPGPA